MTKLFVLTHEYNDYDSAVYLSGVYSTREKAIEAVKVHGDRLYGPEGCVVNAEEAWPNDFMANSACVDSCDNGWNFEIKEVELDVPENI
jgi:hypothetical protein